ncbi:MAG: DUF2214 domain-containing protein [Ectothiorhodospiraceae bacterium]|nr:DUF2214 domain-containing protein [Ectothiorhodospiraceae bacterium]MCH8502709.1 DUF2214 domain-containing protein [Ectothiorhodospiraceae bacterium]
MIGEWLAALEAMSLAAGLRRSFLLYPLVNAGHILGVALLVGAIVPLDLRLLGVWPSVPLRPLWRVLSRMAAVGFGLALLTGILLFMTRATEYTDSSLFLLKMAVLVVGLLNILALRLWPVSRDFWLLSTGRLPITVRVAAVMSLCGWLMVLLLGRLVGYF